MEKKKSKKKIIAIVAVIAVLGLVGVGVTSCVSSTMETLSQSAQMYDDVMPIGVQDLSTSISVSGSVESNNLVKVTTKLNAKVKTLNVDIGDYVKEGDILCVFDSEDIQKEYDDLKESIDKANTIESKNHEINLRNYNNAVADKNTALTQAQNAINEAEVACQNAYDSYNNLVDTCNQYEETKNELYNSLSGITDEAEYQNVYQQYLEYEQLCTQSYAELDAIDSQLSSYDNAVTAAYDAYYAAERSADMNIQSMQDILDAEELNKDNSAQKQLEAIQKQLDECTIKAPQSGIITSLAVAEGSIATTDAIMTIENTDALKITVQIKPVDILKVKEGLKAVIKTDATGETEINGTVTRVVNILSGGNELTQEAGGYTAEITIDDKDTELLIGMSAKAKIIIEERAEALAVPYDAIMEDEENSEFSVYIAESQNDGTYKAKKVIVEKGLESDYYTEIISSEIKQGDIILTSPYLAYDGKTLNVDESMLEDFNEEVIGE